MNYKGLKPGQAGYNPVGRRYDMAVVLSQEPSRRGTRWLCKCDCGNEFVARLADLNSGNTGGCGCRLNWTGSRHRRWKGHGELGGHRWKNIKVYARRRGIPFEVTIEHAWELFKNQEGRCALTGIALEIGTSKQIFTASLDRIDSKKGYVEGNLQWVHKTVNLMKRALDETEFLHWVTLIYEHQQLRPA